MQYRSFTIKSFKGIKQTRIDLGESGEIITLVGLNECGKTTILEAINAFPYADKISEIVQDKQHISQNIAQYIPKHLQANFTGDISISAEVSIDAADKAALSAYVKEQFDKQLMVELVPNRFTIVRTNKFKDSKYVETTNQWSFLLYFEGEDHTRVQMAEDDWRKAIGALVLRLPRIAFFPTFLVEIPDKIFIVGEDTAKNRFYRQIIQDILDSLDENFDIDTHIVQRLPRDQLTHEKWYSSVEKQQVDAVFSRIGQQISDVVLTKWTEIFGERFGKMRITVEPVLVPSGAVKFNYFVKFYVNDGPLRFDISDRSLGFRWFFFFILFTYFRADRKSAFGTVFLFDEPASHLHPKAQRALLENLNKIGQAPNKIIYSTHSHHLVNPKWLERTFIVENKALEDDELVMSKWEREVPEICAIRYRQFVGNSPERVSYFQPVLDALDFVASDIEVSKRSVFLEGKSDYYILTYFVKRFKTCDYNLVPGYGAHDLSPLIALYTGWGKQFVALLDGDAAGEKAKRRYLKDFGLRREVFMNYAEACGISKIKKVEQLIPDYDLDLIRVHFAIKSKPNKKHVMRFFQEIVASGTSPTFSTEFLERMNKVITNLSTRLNKLYT